MSHAPAAGAVQKQRVVVVGNGMVGHRFLDLVEKHQDRARVEVTVVGEEPRAAYDRVNLSAFFDGKTADDLTLGRPNQYQDAGFRFLPGERVASVDRPSKTVRTTSGAVLPYDKLILATGSYPFVPAIAGADTPGCFVYRTLEDLEAIRSWSRERARTGVVIGGGLLGLEAANALRNLGLNVHIVEFAPRLMTLQVDEAGGNILRQRIESLGVSVHTGKVTREIDARIDLAGERAVTRLNFADGSSLPADIVVFSAGIRPRDELARSAGIEVGTRGGVVIDEHCRTSDESIYAIGECAAYEGRTFGLVAPGYHMAKVAVGQVMGGGEDVFTGFDMSTKLKLLGVDVASFGDAFASTPGAHVISAFDSTAAVYKKLVISADRKQLLGGILVGDAGQYGQLLQLVQNQIALPPQPEALIFPRTDGAKPAGLGVESLPGTAVICSCNNVDKAAICQAIADGAQAVPALKSCTKAGTGCGSCVTLVTDILKAELKKSGVVVSNHICEHFPHSRQDLYHLVRLHKLKTFDDLLARHGKGAGCEICKPAVGSILASAWNEHVLERKHIPLQDTNDRFLANIQRDGTYSVVPRVPAGEITPDQLIAVGQVAKRYGLYSKITGGQRIDLFGARLEQLPAIWGELIAAGFESGHAYGKALRTVKSCVGDTWCRYGVQDSVGFATRVENRYKGLRSPHKLKSAVSGCARECAEAQSKDFGIIATEKGWNLYLCGNGGMKPQHAQLFATDLDEETLIRYLDRFLMFYIRTADRLQRTATWLNNLETGGQDKMDYLRSVIVDDKLGICEELDAEMAHVVGTYQCEWKSTLADPDKMARFRPFLNSNTPDPSIVFVPERAQQRPAYPHEKRTLLDNLAAQQVIRNGQARNGVATEGRNGQ